MLVPIPNSSCTVRATDPPRTIKMALALLRRIGSVDAIVADLLRWSEAMTPAHVGVGTRDPEDLFRRLRLRGPVPPDRRVVLIDDVMASGGHVRAAAAFLESEGATIVSAICAARADDSPVIGDAFAVRTVTLESLAVVLRTSGYRQDTDRHIARQAHEKDGLADSFFACRVQVHRRD